MRVESRADADLASRVRTIVDAGPLRDAPTGRCSGENGAPMQGCEQIHDPAFSDLDTTGSRALLDTVPARGPSRPPLSEGLPSSG